MRTRIIGLEAGGVDWQLTATAQAASVGSPSNRISHHEELRGGIVRFGVLSITSIAIISMLAVSTSVAGAVTGHPGAHAKDPSVLEAIANTPQEPLDLGAAV